MEKVQKTFSLVVTYNQNEHVQHKKAREILASLFFDVARFTELKASGFESKTIGLVIPMRNLRFFYFLEVDLYVFRIAIDRSGPVINFRSTKRF